MRGSLSGKRIGQQTGESWLLCVRKLEVRTSEGLLMVPCL